MAFGVIDFLHYSSLFCYTNFNSDLYYFLLSAYYRFNLLFFF